MKRLLMLATVVVLTVVGSGLLLAQSNPQIGSWKLNDAKSKTSSGAGKNTAVVIAAAGDSMKVTVDGIAADGKPTHNEWTGKFDGKDYPVTGDPDTDTRAYKPVSDHTLGLTEKKAGKITNAGRVVVSADGKTRTVTVNGTDANGKKTSIIFVYDKK